ncbi:MAG: WbqC family protein, partial [Duncaniella sp.]|nr:WbqC family protein [Duncaniella sp.]
SPCEPISLPSYWQIREDKLGFIPGLSVLDLIFNLGPEAVLYLDRLAGEPTD